MRGASLPRRSWYGIAGAALLIASGAIHLDLYVTGYQSIPTIGWLFLLQVITAFALAIAIPLTGSRLAVAAVGAGFALSTLGGYLLSVRVGLFGFTEVRTTAGIVSGIIDVAAFAAFALAMVSGLDLGRRVMRAVGAVSVVALALLGAFVATPKTPPAGRDRQQRADAGRQDSRRRDDCSPTPRASPSTVRPGQPEQVRLLRRLRRLLAAGGRERWRPDPGSPGRSARSPGPTAPRRPPMTGIRCTPTSATTRPAGRREQHQPERRALARRAGLGRLTGLDVRRVRTLS